MMKYMQKSLLLLLLFVTGCTDMRAYREGYDHAKNYRMHPDECEPDMSVSISERIKRYGCRTFIAHHHEYPLEPKADVEYCKTNKCLHLPFYSEGYYLAAQYPLTSIAQCGSESDKYFSTNEYLSHLGCVAYMLEHPEKLSSPSADDPGLVRTSPEGLVPIQ